MGAADGLLDAFARALATSAAERDLEEVLAPLCETACAVLGVDAVAVTLAGDEGLRPVATSGEVARRISALQHTLGEGPAVSTLEACTPVVVGDLAEVPEHWPAFSPAVMLAGMRTVVGVPVTAGEQVVGSLDLFAAGANGVGAPELDVARRLASVIGDLVTHHRRRTETDRLVAQLEHALTARVVIEQAKGVLAVRLGITVDEAFEVLRRRARDHNARVADVARAVAQGLLDTDEVGR